MKREGTGTLSTASRLVLDTSVLVEYIVLRSPYRQKVVRLFEASRRGLVKLYVSPVTLSELLYVASRIYQAAGLPNPNQEAYYYVEWVRRRTSLVEVSEEVAVRAGELKKKLRIALPDCYVIASAEAVGAKPLFRHAEEEMKLVIDELRRLGVEFLDELTI